MNGNRSGFRVKLRQEHTTMWVDKDNPSVGVLWAMVGNVEQLFAVVCNGWWLLTISRKTRLAVAGDC